MVSLKFFTLIVTLTLSCDLAANERVKVENMQVKRVGGSGDLVIEVFFIIDNSIYNKWMGYYDNNKDKTIDMLRYHFAHLADGVDQKYRTIDDRQHTYSIKLIGFYIADTPNKVPFIENNKINDETLNMNAALESLLIWVKDNVKTSDNPNKIIPVFDMAVLFTSYETNNFINGIAYRGTVCSTRAAAVVKDYYIMTAVYEAYAKNNNYHTFSPCTRFNFENHTKYLDQTGQNCMSKSNMSRKAEDTSGYLKEAMGLKYSPDFHCEMRLGKGHKFCTPGVSGHADMCREVYCFDPQTKGCAPIGPAFAGSSCGDKMWCMDKKCVQDDRAPAVTDAKNNLDPCIYGDAPNLFHESDYSYTCEEVALDKRKWCPIAKNNCCKTCKGF
ncbi:hypothetical protein HELRODRAFT_177813 [Helobdella robusta]|uniref:ADAMTS cysteine-rich domain-containing protein n=1 Tax=Helobdella robusta TaxID=6412 RepID=T1FCB1_HELRO|nr:hypothetical protein HELRODRAFT_177813 [Helobdella robusta]ESN97751.1 hypothetical protein HELRODRAFT_177813 [Helobdella robusta]